VVDGGFHGVRASRTANHDAFAVRSVRSGSYLPCIATLSIFSVIVGLLAMAAGQGVAKGVLAGGLILLCGLIAATISDTYEEIRLARRRAKPRRRRRPARQPEIDLAEHVPPELRTDQERRAA
jgi:hypothetical protein